jgi:hypothetical protein
MADRPGGSSQSSLGGHAAAPTDDEFEGAAQMLQEMGLSRSEAVVALTRSGGSLELALSRLFPDSDPSEGTARHLLPGSEPGLGGTEDPGILAMGRGYGTFGDGEDDAGSTGAHAGGSEGGDSDIIDDLSADVEGGLYLGGSANEMDGLPLEMIMDILRGGRPEEGASSSAAEASSASVSAPGAKIAARSGEIARLVRNVLGVPTVDPTLIVRAFKATGADWLGDSVPDDAIVSWIIAHLTGDGDDAEMPSSEGYERLPHGSPRGEPVFEREGLLGDWGVGFSATVCDEGLRMRAVWRVAQVVAEVVVPGGVVVDALARYSSENSVPPEVAGVSDWGDLSSRGPLALEHTVTLLYPLVTVESEVTEKAVEEAASVASGTGVSLGTSGWRDDDGRKVRVRLVFRSDPPVKSEWSEGPAVAMMRNHGGAWRATLEGVKEEAGEDDS